MTLQTPGSPGQGVWRDSGRRDPPVRAATVPRPREALPACRYTADPQWLRGSRVRQVRGYPRNPGQPQYECHSHAGSGDQLCPLTGSQSGGCEPRVLTRRRPRISQVDLRSRSFCDGRSLPEENPENRPCGRGPPAAHEMRGGRAVEVARKRYRCTAPIATLR